jgi:hypothetical protein
MCSIGAAARSIVIASSCAIALLARLAFAEDAISDPKAWCADLTKLVAANDIEGAAAMLDQGSRGGAPIAEAKKALDPLMQFVKTGTVSGQAFLAEKDYGGALRHEWFMIIVGVKPVYLRCSLIKYDASWQFTNLDFDTDVDNTSLP